MKVSVFIAASLDGFIAKKDGDVDWLQSFDPMGDGDDGGFSELFNTIDVLVMGRGTFEKVIGFDIDWPYGDKPVVVMSRTLTEVPEKAGKQVSIESCSPKELLEKLEVKGFKHIYLDGGKLFQSFLREELVDELTVTQLPILLGEGIPLFGELGKETRLHLLNCKSWQNGFVQVKYGVEK